MQLLSKLVHWSIFKGPTLRNFILLVSLSFLVRCMDSLMQMVCEYISSLENSTYFALFKSPPSFHETYVIKYNGIQGMGYTRTPTINNWPSVIRQNRHGCFPTGFGI